MTGNSITNGISSAGFNEALQKELGKIKDPEIHKLASALVGSITSSIVRGNNLSGTSIAINGTSWNYLKHEEKNAYEKEYATCKTDEERQAVYEKYKKISDSRLPEEGKVGFIGYLPESNGKTGYLVQLRDIEVTAKNYPSFLSGDFWAGLITGIDDTTSGGLGIAIKRELWGSEIDKRDSNAFYLGKFIGDISAGIGGGYITAGGIGLTFGSIVGIPESAGSSLVLTPEGVLVTAYGVKTVGGAGQNASEDLNILWAQRKHVTDTNDNRVKEHFIGENGVRIYSKTVWQKGKTERVDVENPSPGKRNGQIHYHDSNNKKWLYNIIENKFYYEDGKTLAPSSIQHLLHNKDIRDSIEKAKNKYLGET